MKRLPSLDECVRAYNDAFRNPFDSEGVVLQLAGLPPLEVIQAQLGERLPDSMNRVIAAYDFSWLSIGQVVFEYGDQYMHLVEMNRPGAMAWYRGIRPAARLMIGGTTGWGILAACDTEEVLAYETASSDATAASRIADNFEVFFRLACLIAVDPGWLAELDEMPGVRSGSRFWTMLARGTA